MIAVSEKPYPIKQLRRARAFMSGHGLSVFQLTATGEIGRDAGRPETVRGAQAGFAAFEHDVAGNVSENG
jgi:hypothetical protein